MAQHRRFTFTYKTLRSVDYKADVYLPHPRGVEEEKKGGKNWRAPVLTYYHGGGLVAGSRGPAEAISPQLLNSALSAEFVVISFDYTLTSPDSCFQIIKDAQDGLIWIREDLNKELEEEGVENVRVDSERVIVSGASGGGAVAYFAAIHSPYKLRGLLSYYGEGGDFLLDWYVKEKTEPFCAGIPLLTDLAPFEALRSTPPSTPPTVAANDPLRNQYFLYLLQTGLALDTFAASHADGLGKKLSRLPLEERAKVVPEKARRVVPHLAVEDYSSPFPLPPTFLLHGKVDGIIHLAESQNMAEALRKKSVEVKLWEVEGGDHGFDLDDGWRNGPGGRDEELTRKRNEGLAEVVPWLARQSTSANASNLLTYTYKTLRGVPLKVDVYPPSADFNDGKKGKGKGAPVLCYYHDEAVSAGFVFISFDYTLVSPDSGVQIIEDARDGLLFVRDRLNFELEKEGTKVRVDPERVAVAGSSGGGAVAYYAAINSPYKLRALLSFYGQGGNLLLDWYITNKTEPFLQSLPLLTDFFNYTALEYQPPAAPPTISTNYTQDTPRNLYLLYLLQTGEALNVFSGAPGLSQRLSPLSLEERPDEVPKRTRKTIPHLAAADYDAPFPFSPTLLLHGTADEIVPLEESRTMFRALQSKGVEVNLMEVEGGPHGFDDDALWAAGPGGGDEEWTRKRDEAIAKVVPWLKKQVEHE
ncbi:hypothetical protein JCM8547_009344 [Rhodosporidiobolus lusitaniae]